MNESWQPSTFDIFGRRRDSSLAEEENCDPSERTAPALACGRRFYFLLTISHFGSKDALGENKVAPTHTGVTPVAAARAKP